MRAEGSSEKTILEALKVSRAPLCRWKKPYKELGLEGLEEQSRIPINPIEPTWTGETEKIVLKFRKKYSLFGKNKRAVMPTRSTGKVISVSTIGRILRKLLREDLIKPAVFYVMGKVPKNPRLFTSHAQRSKYHMRAVNPGEMLQIDHMTIDFHGKVFKHLPPYEKTVSQLYTNATSTTVTDFLYELRTYLPFDLSSIQVDGG